MGLSSLDAALSGLRVSQQQLTVLSGNIANVGTPGYTRKILPQLSQAVNGVTVGALGGTIVRNVDLNLEKQLWTQTSAVASLNIQQAYLNKIQQFHGPPDQELSIAAELGRLQDSFSSLSDSPSDPNLQTATVNEAVDAASKINDLSSLITQQRNAAQDEMTSTVQRVNDLLSQIAGLNSQIENSTNTNRSSADAEDKRDAAVSELSGLIDVSTFRRGDGVLVVQTSRGVELATDTVAKPLTFAPTGISALTYYPKSVAGVYVGDPNTDISAVDVTAQDLGGKLGGLLDLRDSIFPKQMAQLDELSEQLAQRMNNQGLELFTDASGNLPPDTPPDPSTNPPTPVPYTGFSATIQVNQAILNNHALVQQGTYNAGIPAGDNQVIRRVIQFAFGSTDYQQAIGQISLAAEAVLPFPSSTIQNYFGVHSTNEVDGTKDLSGFASPAALIASANGALAPGSDTFRLTFQDANLGLGPVNIDVSLSAIPNTGGDFTQDMISYINATVIPALGAPQQADLASMNVSFSEGANGQLAVKSNAAITVDGTNPPNAMGAAGLAFLGLGAGTAQPQDPYFDIQVGDAPSVRITINSGDTPATLLAKLQAVPGLAVQDYLSVASPDGHLRLRPGDNYSNPDFGGDLKIIAGPGTTSNAFANVVIGPGAVPDGVNIVSALFSSFSVGPPLQDLSAVSSVGYQSQISATNVSTIPFRTTLLGPGANISTNILGAQTIVGYAQQMVDEQSQQASNTASQATDQQSLQTLLQDQLSNDSGVNLDEEMGNLIVVQNAYASAARVISAVSDMFNELLNAVNA